MKNNRRIINNIFNKIVSIMEIALLLFTYLFIAPINKVNAVTYNQTIINANSSNSNGIDAFPESYRILLNELVRKTGHTNWKFKAFYTDIDWNELSKNENKCLRNTIYKTNPSTWFCSANWKHLEDGKCGDGYYCASPSIVNYYLDPRNFFTEVTIFQFLNLGYDSSESIEVIQQSLDGSFMEGNATNGEKYANILYDAARESGESALSIITRIYQEIGKGSPGNPPHMVSGNDGTYPNTYNFFNYGATDGTGAQKRGLAYADSAGWHDPRTAIIEGAKLIANNYTKEGQNTKYTFKFDIVGSEYNQLYSHQYMTNLQDPTNQAKILFDKYANNGWLSNDLIFVIPVYKNMPLYNKLPSNLTGSELYYVSSGYTAPYLRTGIGTGTSAICKVSKDTLVSMVQYNAGIDRYGVVWHKIRLEDGTEGYMTSEYLTKVNNIWDSYYVPSQPVEENNNSGSNNTENVGIKFEQDKCIITPNTTIADIKKSYTVISATNDGNNIGDNDALPTGTIIRTNEGEFTIVKLGDINKDGNVNTGDTFLIKQVIMEVKSLENENQIRAADLNNDGNINTGDSFILKKYIMDVADIII